MAEVQELQKRLDTIKSEIENLQLQIQNNPEGNNDGMQEKINILKDEQVEVTRQIEQQTGLSGSLGDVHRG